MVSNDMARSIYLIVFWLLESKDYALKCMRRSGLFAGLRTRMHLAFVRMLIRFIGPVFRLWDGSVICRSQARLLLFSIILCERYHEARNVLRILNLTTLVITIL